MLITLSLAHIITVFEWRFVMIELSLILYILTNIRNSDFFIVSKNSFSHSKSNMGTALYQHWGSTVIILQ